MNFTNFTKQLMTAQARMLLIGGTLERTLDDAGHPAFIVTRGHFTKEFPTLCEACQVITELEKEKV